MDYKTFEEDVEAIKRGEKALSCSNFLLLKIYEELKKFNEVNGK